MLLVGLYPDEQTLTCACSVVDKLPSNIFYKVNMSESQVIKSIREYLECREAEHPPVVVWWERLASGKVKTEWGTWIQLSRSGTPDFLCVFIGKNKQLINLFVEAKSPDVSAKPRAGSQVSFKNKYHNRHVDMHYMIAQSPKDVKNKINELAYDFMKDIKL